MKKITLWILGSMIVLNSTAQNVGIGTTTPNRAKLEVNGVAGTGATSGIFGGDGTGISLQKDWPSLGFNQYRDIGTGYGKHIGTGYAANQYLDPNTGSLFLDMLSSGAANTEITTSNRALQISNLGNVGLRGTFPNSELQFPNTLNNRKITLWEVANNSNQFYGFGIKSGELIYNLGEAGAKHTFLSAGNLVLLQFGSTMDLYANTQNIILSKPVGGDNSLMVSDRPVGTPQQASYYISNSVMLGRGVFQGSAGDNSVSVGYKAGYLIGGTGTGPYKLDNCTLIGNLTNQIVPANYVNNTFRNSTAIGYQTTISGDNQVRIGNYDITSIGGTVGWSTLSDKRLKKNISNHVAGLDFIMRLKPSQYQYSRAAYDQLLSLPKEKNSVSENQNDEKENTIYTGFIAQEVEEAANQAGFNFSGIDKPKNPNGLYALRYADFVVPLVKAVQEQQQIIEKQQQQIDVLTKEIQLLKEKTR